MKPSRFSFMRRPLFWVVLVVLMVLVAGGAYYYFNQPAARTQTTVTVTRGDLKATVNANARVRAKKSVKLAFPLSGLVKKVNVQIGEDVQPGEVLAELDAPEAARRLEQAQLNLRARQQDLTDAQQPPQAQELEIAQQGLKKAAFALAAAQDQYKKDATDEHKIAQDLARSDYDIARANFERQTRGPTQSQLDNLQRAIDNANLDLQAAQEAVHQTKLQAPFAGSITDITLDEGQLLGGYNQVLSLADLSQLELVADIDEIDVAQVNPGQSVDLRFDAFPGEIVMGTLSRLYPAASNDRGATVYQGIISPNPTELKLRPGMGATVNIATVEKKNVLRVPTRAIKSAGTQKIVVVQDGSATRNVVVATGVSDGTNTEIISGVAEGTVIIIE